MNDALLTALVIALVLIVIYLARERKEKTGEGFAAALTEATPPRLGPHQAYPGGPYNPYTVLNKEIDELRGARNDGYNQVPVWRQPHGLDRYHRAGASVKPADIAAAEREAWYSSDAAGAGGGGYNPETMYESFTAGGANEAAAGPDGGEPSMDYATYITDLIVDPRTRENHTRWVEEMKPWSGTAMTVDNMDEAMEASTDFIGLRRPQPVAVYNPTSLTERDTWTFIQNAKFNFKA